MTSATETDVAADVGDRVAKCDKLTQGRELNLADLELQHVPPIVLGFSTLVKLNLRHNHLSSLPIDLVESVPLLEVLNVAENALTNLPPDIGGLPRLRQLFAQANRLRSLPLSLMSCSKLQELYVQHNAIRDVPDEFAHLTSLSVLSLAQNDLVYLPKSLNSLQNLKIVDLSGNAGLATAPELLRRLHEKNLVLHSKEKRRELITRALKVKTAVAAALKKQAREIAKG